MTTSFMPQPAAGNGAELGKTIATGLGAGLAFLGLVVAGTTFFALALAFPMALPIAEALDLVVTRADAGLAEQVSAAWWAFAALGAAFFSAAILVLTVAIRALTSAPRA